MDPLFGQIDQLGWVFLKVLLLSGTAVVGFRTGGHRTLSQLSPFDFVAAVAVGAIVGQLPSAHDATFLTGAATLASVLFGHWSVTRLRRWSAVSRVLTRPPPVLVLNGRALPNEMRRCGLTQADLFVMLRQQGIEDLGSVRFAILEDRGQLSVIREMAQAVGKPDQSSGTLPVGGIGWPLTS